jgi:ribonuclease VapC
MMILDATALVALTLRQAEADRLAEQIDGAAQRLTHPLAVYAATAAIVRESGRSVDGAYHDLADLMTAAGIDVVAIGQPETITALEAHARYGKGGRHPAQLNMEECFSYALAKLRSAELAYAGEAFSETDLARS